MALTTIPSELSSVSGISDSSTSTAITINSSQEVTFAGNITTGSNTISGVLSSVTGSLGSAATATTQAASDNTTKIATTAYVTTALANMVDSAPGTLNTLNELAAALGDDANFSTTVTNSIATKLPLAGGTMTGAIAHSGNFSIDAAGEIHLDADGEVIRIRHDGGDVGMLQMTSNDFIIRSMVGDKDLIFKGNDGGSVITALTLDMSEGGNATFGGSVTATSANISGTAKIEKSGQAINLDTPSSSQNVWLNFSDNGSAKWEIQKNTANLLNIYSYDAGANVMTFDGSSVGIGASSINRKLEIAGNNNGGAKANYIRITDTDTTATANNQQGGIEFYASDSSGGAGIAASMEVLYAGSGGGGEITFNTNASSGGTLTEALRIDEQQNVGIGTSPSAKLDVSEANSKSATGVWQILSFDETSQTTGVGGGITFGGYKTAQSAAEYFAAIDSYKENSTAGNAAGSLRFHTQVSGGSGVVERMRIDSSGNVAIGTSTVLDGLNIYASSATNLRLHNGTTGASTSAGGIIQQAGDEMYVWNYEPSNLIFGTNNAARVRIASGGRQFYYGMNSTNSVGSWAFGHPADGSSNGYLSSWTTVFGHRLHLRTNNGSTPSQNGTVSFSGSGANNFRIMQNMGYNGSYWNSSTETGSGTTYEQANANFYWANTNSVTSGSAYTVTNRMHLRNDGNLYVDGTVYENQTISDARLKQDVEDFPSALENVKALRTVKFNWIDEDRRGEQKEIGMIAQEVKEIYPELVGSTTSIGMTEDPDTGEKIAGEERYAIHYQKLSIVLLKAMQEQQEMIETLQAEVAALKGE